MAGRPQNRLELRRQYEAAEPLDPVEDESLDVPDLDEDTDEEERKPKKKKVPSKPRAVKAPKPAARMRIVWTVVNDAFKPVATFEYAKKDEAEARAAELTAKGKGTHFVQKTKEPMPDDAPGLGAALPREAVPAAAAAKAKATPVLDDDEEIENDDEADTEADDDFPEDDDED
jgi:hypothetical protein